ncbi:hypothetical protein [Reyranella sp.]|uniref:hypothetical protein n=1 Tax=Reyranella sp. TaxID=1929291 RepID=UPI003D0A5C02
MTAAWLEAHARQAGLAILLTALVLRLYMAFLAGVPHLGSDGLTYIEMADAILDGTPMSFFPNGYPILLAALAHLMGEADPQPAWLLMNVLMSTGIVAFVLLIAGRWLDPALALAAAAVIAVWPTQLYYTAQFLSDIPSAFFLTFGIHLALRQQPVAAGCVLGIAALVRDSLLPSVLLLAAIGMVAPERRRGVARLLLAVGVVQALEWILEARGVTAPSSTAGLNLLLAVTSMSTEGIPAAPPGLSPEQMAHPWATYFRFALEHPGTFILQRLASLYELWGPWPNAGDPGDPRGVLVRLVIGLRFPLLMLALGGLWIGRRHLETWMIAAPLIGLTAVHIAFFSASPRFTIPMEPTAIVLAALAVQRLVKQA